MPEKNVPDPADDANHIFHETTPAEGLSAESAEDSSPSLILPSVLRAEPREAVPAAEKSEKTPEKVPGKTSEKSSPESQLHDGWQQAPTLFPHRHPVELMLRFLQKQFSLPMLNFLEATVVTVGHLAVLAGAMLMPIYGYYGTRNPAGVLSETPAAAGGGSLGTMLAFTLLLLAFQYITWRIVRDFKFWNLQSPGRLSSRSICDITSSLFLFLGLASLLTCTLNGLFYKEYILPFFGMCLCLGCMYIAFYALHPALSAIRFAEKNPPEEEIFSVCIFLAKLIFMRGAFMFYGLVSLIVVALATYFFFAPQNIFQVTFFANYPSMPRFFTLCLLGTAMAPLAGCVLYLFTAYVLMALRAVIIRGRKDSQHP